jgi:hypothetical protein
MPLDTDDPPTYDGDPDTGGLPRYNTDTIRRFVLNRHQGTVGVLFMDNSASNVYLKELWTLRWHKSFDTSGYSGVWPDWMMGMKDF